jgi:hypothetical protein
VAYASILASAHLAKVKEDRIQHAVVKTQRYDGFSLITPEDRTTMKMNTE